MNLIELNKLNEQEKKQRIDELIENPNKNAVYYFNLGLLNLSLTLYDAAIKYFKKTIEIEFDYAEAYYYLSLSYLKGKPPRYSNDSTIVKIEDLINGALFIKKSFKFYLLFAFINYDFYYRVGLMINGGYEKFIKEAKKMGLTNEKALQFLEELRCEDDPFKTLILVEEES